MAIVAVVDAKRLLGGPDVMGQRPGVGLGRFVLGRFDFACFIHAVEFAAGDINRFVLVVGL